MSGAPAGPVLPTHMFERARLLHEGRLEVADARHASTVALLREASVGGGAGPEVYLLRRVRGMAFAGGMHVFPGGAVDPADAAAELTWQGPSPAQWASQLGVPEPLARSLVCAAVRETFEESGVLLAGPPGEGGGRAGLLADVSTDEWEAERVALEAREQSLSELLVRRGLVLRADLLRHVAHWITPEVEPKRFDTHFFLAEMPGGQIARSVGGEADHRTWLPPQEALDRGLRLMPPTHAVLSDLARFEDVAGALAAEREVVTVMPKLLVQDDGEVAFLVPGDPGYPAEPQTAP